MIPSATVKRVLACVFVAAVCGGCGAATSAHAHVNRIYDRMIGGKFAGYLWDGPDGPVTSVHGAWTVPGIRSGSRDGHASTWIGAEAPGGKNAPFIQIGITEDRPLPSEQHAGQDRYAAFWSDEPHGFHPVELFPVSPGDKVEAKMTLSDGSWQLAITDLTSGRHAAFQTKQEASYTFNLAEWLQEDVTDSRTDKPFPYPDMAPTDFRDITVNAKTPADNQLDSQWISAEGNYYGTTPAVDGAFVVHEITAGSIAGRYVAMAAPEDTVALRLSQLLTSGSDVSQHKLTAGARDLARAMDRTAKQLSSQHWPHDVSADIARLIKETRYIASHLTAMHVATREALGKLLSAPTPFGDEHITAATIHQLLGIPYPE